MNEDDKEGSPPDRKADRVLCRRLSSPQQGACAELGAELCDYIDNDTDTSSRKELLLLRAQRACVFAVLEQLPWHVRLPRSGRERPAASISSTLSTQSAAHGYPPSSAHRYARLPAVAQTPLLESATLPALAEGLSPALPFSSASARPTSYASIADSATLSTKHSRVPVSLFLPSISFAFEQSSASI